MTSTTALREVLAVRGGDAPPDGEVTITGADPVLDTRFRIALTATCSLLRRLEGPKLMTM